MKIAGLPIEDDLGDGLSGEVYLVRLGDDPDDLAVLKRHRKWEYGVSESEFEEEIRINREKPIRKNMPRFLRSGRDETGTLYFLMTYAGKLPPKDGLSAEEWFTWTLELVGALERLNMRKRIFHRDLKPKNMRSSGGHPVIIDFGLAVRRPLEDRSRHFIERVGSLDWMAPEILRFEPYTVGAEIHSAMKTVEAIASNEFLDAARPALAHATEHNPKLRTPNWRILRRELKERRRIYRRNESERRPLAKLKAVTRPLTVAAVLLVVAYALAYAAILAVRILRLAAGCVG